jgi:hypothetical protein
MIEIERPLVPALRMSDALPNTAEHGQGDLHILYGERDRPVGYLVRKSCVEDAWESLDPRFYITTSHSVAIRLLGTPFAELPTTRTAVTLDAEMV